jgi:hypothetical protein
VNDSAFVQKDAQLTRDKRWMPASEEFRAIIALWSPGCKRPFARVWRSSEDFTGFAITLMARQYCQPLQLRPAGFVSRAQLTTPASRKLSKV